VREIEVTQLLRARDEVAGEEGQLVPGDVQHLQRQLDAAGSPGVPIRNLASKHRTIGKGWGFVFFLSDSGFPYIKAAFGRLDNAESKRNDGIWWDN
jgi:hypothetical protein